MTNEVKKCEEEAERARARLDLNLEELQSRLTLQSLADETVGAIRRTSYGRIVDDAFAVVRSNQIPVVLAGAALAIFAIQLGEENLRRRRRPIRSTPRNNPPAWSPDAEFDMAHDDSAVEAAAGNEAVAASDVYGKNGIGRARRGAPPSDSEFSSIKRSA